MAYVYETILKNGIVVDPVNNRSGRYDVGISEGRIKEIAQDIDPGIGREVFDLKGLYVVPGIIDLHIHASEWIGGKFSHKMMALAGVTTALDMAGPIDGVLSIARDFGAGLNLASIQYVRPGFTVKSSDPSKAELNGLLDKSLAAGAIGLKILGGHYPLTPQATALAIEAASEKKAYIAMHAGTLESESDIAGLHEVLALANGNAVHVAHINSYCRGSVKKYMVETEEALTAIHKHPHISSESYLSRINGTSAKCSNGIPESNATSRWLEFGGFDTTETGMEKAILAGWAQVNAESGGTMILVTGKTGLDCWRKNNTDTTVSFSVNPPEPRIRLATAKNESDEFIVDCISTDGGGIPRNSIVQMGLGLVRIEALDMDEFVIKTSRNPAKILGLENKGHLAVGADADITVVDLERQRPYMSLGNGQLISYRGHVCGKGTHMITTPAGKANVVKNKLETIVVDPAVSPFLKRQL